MPEPTPEWVAAHRIPDIPITVHNDIDPDGPIWTATCLCGYGLSADSPEAAVLGMAAHLTAER